MCGSENNENEKIFCIGSKNNGSAQDRRIWAGKDTRKKNVDPRELVRGKVQGGVSVTAALGVSHQGLGAVAFVEKGMKIKKDVYEEQVKNVYVEHNTMRLLSDRTAFMQDGPT